MSSSDHLATTAARDSTCARCGAPTLVGLAEGLTARVDVTPLPDRAAEIAALLANKATYTRMRNKELVHRDAGRIGDPHLRGDIHAQHKCLPTPRQGDLFDTRGMQ